ncbi:GntR family transcriptional regulator [Gracilibacillus thailandensis]|uniref:FCD domain-containing protein n=1 Tax=Gracilibacillus thailandensis TaxID=563735 RepID=A0A6N7R1T3_9BACI|nr:GntR family transcriptional regulator [Gracilibacillus thailandensis]MRI67260.1 FCD domain-containing protein [Gracilibacillus thailandensis]
MHKDRTHVQLSARDKMYEHIKNRIINLDYEPGEKISEKDVALHYNVSKTPVREAFLKLAEEELIKIYPQRYTAVSKIDLDLVEEGRFLRENIECAIVKEACNKLNDDYFMHLELNLKLQQFCIEKGSYQELFGLDEEFHRLLFEMCNKLRIWKLMRSMNSHFDRLRVLRLASNHDWKILFDQHTRIFDNISSGQPEKAEKVMLDHLNLVHFETKELKKQYLDYFE